MSRGRVREGTVCPHMPGSVTRAHSLGDGRKKLLVTNASSAHSTTSRTCGWCFARAVMRDRPPEALSSDEIVTVLGVETR
jgi:hypothetical protein